MLLAVNMGRPQSPKSLLSRRRSSRRLLLVNLPCIVAFTRNPSWLRVLRKVDTFSNPGNTERFRVFYEILPPIIGGFASLRTSSFRSRFQGCMGMLGFRLEPPNQERYFKRHQDYRLHQVMYMLRIEPALP